MAKKKQKSSLNKINVSKSTELKTSDDSLIKYQNYIFVGILCLVILLFFREGFFGGKLFASADNLSPLSFRNFLDDAKSLGIFPLWLPYIFGGMPSLASLTTGLPAAHNIFSYIWDSIFNAYAGWNLFKLTAPYYIIFAIGVFIYAKYKFKNNYIALFCGLTAVLATPIIQLIIVGHHTKMFTIALFPFILYIIDRITDEDPKGIFKLILYVGILSVILYIQFHFHHIQMLFYSYMFLGIYFVYSLIFKFIRKEKVSGIIKALSIGVIALILTIAMDANILLSIKEYNQFSIRGQQEITLKNDPASNQDTPLSYNYATNWSFSPGEVLTFIIPYYYGFGDVEVDGQRANLYWGQMPFTDSPVYFGVIVLLLALFGIILNIRKSQSVQALTFITVFFLFLSFGRTFPIIYDAFFYNLPYFSSFRAPVMIHYYMDFAFVILAGFGIKSILDLKSEKAGQERLKTLAYIFGGLALLMLLISFIGFENSYKDSVLNGPKVKELIAQGNNPQQINQYFSQISQVAYKNLIKDMRLHSFLILLIIGSMFAFVKNSFKQNIFLIILILVATLDLWNISSDTLHWESGTTKENAFGERDYVNFILQNDPDTFKYRVAEISGGRLATSNHLAYYGLHLFNGYHGAKIRNYQDAIDVAGDLNPLLLSLANVKYLISDQPLPENPLFEQVFKGTKLVYRNNGSLQRAFFVNSYQVMDGFQILQQIKQNSFDPSKTALLESDPGIQIQPATENASVNITHFDIHNIKYNVNATGTNLLVFSEIFYPAGWKLYIEGKESEILKVDYLFRGAIVPPGHHEIRMEFHPQSYYTGKNVSIVANIIVIGFLISGALGIYLQRKKNLQPQPADDSKQDG